METLIEEPKPRWSGRQLVWLLSHQGIGPAKALMVARSVPDPGEFEDRWPELRGQMGSWADVILPAVPVPERRFDDVGCVGFFDDDYPAPLSKIPNPPAVIWVRGALPSFARAVAVVGTRHPDAWGSAVAAFAARWSTELSAVVVSGLALGCDTIAHEETLVHDGTTVAVLGGSLNAPSPAANRGLAEMILERGGALISEVLPDAAVEPRTLVQRNRIQSGLSQATVVAQTSIPGGTLHTARFTLEQNRGLVVPEPTGEYRDSPASAGNLLLTRTPPPRADLLAEVLHTTKRLSAELATRPRIADAAPRTHDELRAVLTKFLS